MGADAVAAGRVAPRVPAKPAVDPGRAEIAHVLRRTTFGPFPGDVDAALTVGRDAELSARIDAAPLPFEPPADIDQRFSPSLEATLGANSLVTMWVSRMCDSRAGLHERMMWFWHGHFTTSLEKSTFLLVWRQLRLIHEHALGNFVDLTKAIAVDPAMLQYLDGSGSQFSAPNENFGRELMELYTMGRGNYTEDDVRAAARAFSGWQANRDGERPGAVFSPPDGPTGPLTFLGRTADFDASSAVDQIMAQPVVATFIVGKLWDHFIGGPQDPELIGQWAGAFRSTGYEIQPLVSSMVTSDAFSRAQRSRAKFGIEWLCAVLRILEIKEPLNVDSARNLGQVPYYPPNVAGWPNAWTSSSSLFARQRFVDALLTTVDLDALGVDSMADAIERCSLYDLSAPTTAGLDRVEQDARGTTGADRSRLLIRSALLTPEFAVA